MGQPINPYSSPAAADPRGAGTPRETLVLDFALHETDWEALVTYLSLHSPLARRRNRRLYGRPALILGLLGGALSILALLVALRPASVGGPAEGLAIALPIGFLLALLAFRGLFRGAAARRQVRHYAREILRAGGDRVLLGPHQVVADPGGLQMGSGLCRHCVAWEALQTIARYGEHVVLMWSPASGFLVPGGAFADTTQRDDLVATCQAYAPHVRLDPPGP